MVESSGAASEIIGLLVVCNYPLAQTHSRLLMAYAGVMTYEKQVIVRRINSESVEDIFIIAASRYTTSRIGHGGILQIPVIQCGFREKRPWERAA
ncbi:hypothetical protein F2P81_002351 [Scophthalmus maximus]|uniref:Uncharacterized protein n=1 Tax=Scophthalmus maximus TaxID=52904 RepID=A0A6A4TUY8_SCOMX|nr:hypothetical protein F2P81_002351 [Scophthalmus maximus]